MPEKELGLQIFKEVTYVVHDAWMAQDIGSFTTKEDAKTFINAVRKSRERQ